MSVNNYHNKTVASAVEFYFRSVIFFKTYFMLYYMKYSIQITDPLMTYALQDSLINATSK